MTERERFDLPDSLDDVSREQLQEWKLFVEESTRSIKSQLEGARAGVRDGEYADRDWYHRATMAFRIRGGQLQRINLQLGKIREQRKAANQLRSEHAVTTDHLQFMHAFQRAAKERLSEADYSALVTRAFEWKDAGHPNATDCDRCGLAVQIASAR